MPNYSISPELVDLCKRISCSFIDARTSSKDYVGSAARVLLPEIEKQEGVLLSTCLRFEIYRFDGPQKPTPSLFYADGITCVRRLLSIMTGLQSEIVGEKEILMQVEKSINDAFESKKIDDVAYLGLQNLLQISQKVRRMCSVETNENYSTIGASLLNKHLSQMSNAVVMVIGAGYMSEAFLKAIDVPLRKLIWANRSVSKLQKKVKKMKNISGIEIIFCDLDEVRQKLVTADIIFSAIGNSPLLFKSEKFKSGVKIIDVSYPQVFAEFSECDIINIANTHFDKLVNKPIAKKNITLANREIDNIISIIL
ncbi:MAG: hypothetical protein WCO10_02895 [bacterium]